MLTSICGINWGDEGKGRMVDLLSSDFDIVCRYQGGNNAGHTVINDKGKFILNLLPSGILREDVVKVMGNGMVIDIKHLCEEMGRLKAQGIKITPENLKISDKAVITMPYNVLQDCLEEDRLAGKKFGSTRRGIAPVYADKYMKKAFRMGELLNTELLYKRLPDIVEWKNLSVVNGYNSDPVTTEAMIEYFETYGKQLKDYVCDVSVYL
ncbi:MAG: adenylosuccinate synthetase, partial [Clostridia bacterium]|nr:adenylosuccinate synthetase [Clostridia bacterium]